MNTDEDDENGHLNTHKHADGIPSNTELAERMAHVEATLDHVDDKLDHQAATLNRIADRLEDNLTETQETIEKIESEHTRLWLVYQGVKWAIVVGSGSSLLALFMSVVIGVA